MQVNVLDLGKIDYGEALEIQNRLVELRQKGCIDDTLIILEHPPTLTLGVRGQHSNILAPSEILRQKNIKTYEINRGGDVTYHGDGQIVGYPIFDLTCHGRDIKKFIWNIEEIFIKLLKEEYSIDAHREEMKYTGVWVGNEKITAIGMAVRHHVTMHGFAFNVNTNLDHFNLINPCGLTDKGVTSIQKLTGQTQDFEMAKDLLLKYFSEIFDAITVEKSLKDLGVTDVRAEA